MKPLALAFFALSLASATAHAASTLPGNASSLTEAHDDWTVRCAVTDGLVHCAAQQEQLSNQTKQRVLAIDVSPGSSSPKGTLVLPFGLDLAKGAVLKVDDKLTSPPLPFQTCMPGGCLVPFDLGQQWETALRGGTALAVSAIAVGGQDAKFSISLKGFASALDRITDLTK